MASINRRSRPTLWLWLAILLLSVSVWGYALQQPGETVIVAIGDSITAGGTNWGNQFGHDNKISGGWVTRLQSHLDKDFPSEYRVVNKGLNGDNAKGVLKRLPSAVISLNPGIVLIAIGTNDGYGYTKLYPSSRTVETFRAVMDTLLSELHQQLPGTAVFVVGFTSPVKKYADTFGLSGLLSGYDQETLDTKFKQYNEALKEVVKTFGYSYIDISSQWPGDTEARWELLADGLHPNDAGYDKMAELIYTALRDTVVHPVTAEPTSISLSTWGALKEETERQSISP